MESTILKIILQTSRAVSQVNCNDTSAWMRTTWTNQAKVIFDKPLAQGNKVYFYKPTSWQEVQQQGRRAKHLMHYQGPAIIIGSISGRKRQYEVEYNGKRYKRYISMLIPEQTMLTIDVTTLDVTDSRESGAKPKLHINGA